jgi:plastocyanin
VSIVANSGSAAFSPNPTSVPGGQTLQFRNTATGTHRIVADDGSWDTGTLTSGATSLAMTIARTGAYHCTIHASMVGSIN